MSKKEKYISFLDYINGGELFTHLSQRERFTEPEVQVYAGEIVLALEHLHKVRRPPLRSLFREQLLADAMLRWERECLYVSLSLRRLRKHTCRPLGFTASQFSLLKTDFSI